MQRWLMVPTAACALHTAAAYTAAYVEHAAISPCGQGSCGTETKEANVKAYSGYAEEAAAKGADIIVFPEYGVTGFSNYPASQWGTYAEPVPNATPSDVPCDLRRKYAAAPTVVALSCLAKANRIAVVANMADQPSRNVLYNTDVVFDTDGSYLAKYHKMNLWDEPNMNVPSDCPEVTFRTSFGVTFGLITCADVIYRYPTQSLVDRGVRDFVVPVAWDNSMAQMQVLGFMQGLSMQAGATLVVANHRTPEMSGSGVWSAGRVLDYFFSPGSTAGPVRVVEVPTAAPAPTPRSEPVLAQPDTGARWAFAPLSSGHVCSGGVCCTATAMTGSTDGYVIAALDGDDVQGGTQWAAQVCAILPCHTASDQCLQFNPPTGSLRRVVLSATGISSVVFPEILGWRRGLQTALQPGTGNDSFEFSGSNASIATADVLLSAVLYGRKFASDSLPYDCH
eukprot:TRINITY_DN13288_c0_g1_i1.p1 TRINITY_DN13288_c0_g1~~TRINITY_DN13288_c0_g1_i1.p1  ORF type:complete len:466 (+),score=105.01 TRINITY_DN13288_c0_g1_i1:47-1399(+)